MKPLPWSPSSLSDFVSCPRSYYEKRIAKSVPQIETPEMSYGTHVHKCFEDRQRDGKPLPADLEPHEEFLLRMATMPGELFAEQKVALNRSLQPCDFFAPDAWMRCVIDYLHVRDDKAVIVDYKTGKPHNKFDQLQQNALWVWAKYPGIDRVEVMYYWTKTSTTTEETYTRADIPRLWSRFTPDLKQYSQAFKTDTWQPRKSGLCNGWCPVTTCEFWQPRRAFR